MWGSLFTAEEIERMQQIIETCDKPKARKQTAKKSKKRANNKRISSEKVVEDNKYF